jgi:hypothetical protein
MASFFGRVEELLALIGWEPSNLYTAIGLDKSTFSKWKSGVAEANRDVLKEMSRRFLVSMDSLLAEEGTNSLEPSPILRRAHLLLVDRVQEATASPETAAQRLSLAYDLLKATLGNNLTIETWAAYLRTTVGGWLEIQHGHRSPDVDNLAGAAHLLGWYDLSGAWLHWLETGSLDRLRPSEESTIRLVRRQQMMGILPTHIIVTMENLLAERNPFTEKQ